MPSTAERAIRNEESRDRLNLSLRLRLSLSLQRDILGSSTASLNTPEGGAASLFGSPMVMSAEGELPFQRSWRNLDRLGCHSAAGSHQPGKTGLAHRSTFHWS
ncbi:MAG: hypothetical protein JWQ73_16 [Variovorax sp.]|nr:hypothetical protein [Variovorax sp.]